MRFTRYKSRLFPPFEGCLSSKRRKLPFSVQVQPALAIRSITLSSGLSEDLSLIAEMFSMWGTGADSSSLALSGCLSVTARTGIRGSAVVFSCSFIADGMRLMGLSYEGERDLERSLCSLNCFLIWSTLLSLLWVLFFCSIFRMISLVLPDSST